MIGLTLPARPRRARTGAPVGRPARNRRRRERAVTLVEFALVAPIGFLVILSLLVMSVFILNDIELTNGVRDGARAGAICGTQMFGGQPFNSPTTLTLPDGQACNVTNLVKFVQNRIKTIPGVTPSVSIDFTGCTGSCILASTCSPGQKILVSASYQQPLFVPLVGYWLGDSGNPQYRTINAEAEATCEQ